MELEFKCFRMSSYTQKTDLYLGESSKKKKQKQEHSSHCQTTSNGTKFVINKREWNDKHTGTQIEFCEIQRTRNKEEGTISLSK